MVAAPVTGPAATTTGPSPAGPHATAEAPRRAVRTLALFAGARADQRRPAVGRRCPGAGRRGWDRKDAPCAVDGRRHGRRAGKEKAPPGTRLSPRCLSVKDDP